MRFTQEQLVRLLEKKDTSGRRRGLYNPEGADSLCLGGDLSNERGLTLISYLVHRSCTIGSITVTGSSSSSLVRRVCSNWKNFAKDIVLSLHAPGEAQLNAMPLEEMSHAPSTVRITHSGAIMGSIIDRLRGMMGCKALIIGASGGEGVLQLLENLPEHIRSLEITRDFVPSEEVRSEIMKEICRLRERGIIIEVNASVLNDLSKETSSIACTRSTMPPPPTLLSWRQLMLSKRDASAYKPQPTRTGGRQAQVIFPPSSRDRTGLPEDPLSSVRDVLAGRLGGPSAFFCRRSVDGQNVARKRSREETRADRLGDNQYDLSHRETPDEVVMPSAKRARCEVVWPIP